MLHWIEGFTIMLCINHRIEYIERRTWWKIVFYGKWKTFFSEKRNSKGSEWMIVELEQRNITCILPVYRDITNWWEQRTTMRTNVFRSVVYRLPCHCPVSQVTMCLNSHENESKISIINSTPLITGRDCNLLLNYDSIRTPRYRYALATWWHVSYLKGLLLYYVLYLCMYEHVTSH